MSSSASAASMEPSASAGGSSAQRMRTLSGGSTARHAAASVLACSLAAATASRVVRSASVHGRVLIQRRVFLVVVVVRLLLLLFLFLLRIGQAARDVRARLRRCKLLLCARARVHADSAWRRCAQRRRSMRAARARRLCDFGDGLRHAARQPRHGGDHGPPHTMGAGGVGALGIIRAFSEDLLRASSHRTLAQHTRVTRAATEFGNEYTRSNSEWRWACDSTAGRARCATQDCKKLLDVEGALLHLRHQVRKRQRVRLGGHDEVVLRQAANRRRLQLHRHCAVAGGQRLGGVACAAAASGSCASGRATRGACGRRSRLQRLRRPRCAPPAPRRPPRPWLATSAWQTRRGVSYRPHGEGLESVRAAAHRSMSDGSSTSFQSNTCAHHAGASQRSSAAPERQHAHAPACGKAPRP